MGPLRIAAVYVGTVVGAGFASGQEVSRFFTQFGLYGILGTGLAAVLFAVFGVIVLELGRRLGANSHGELIRAVGGPQLGPVLDTFVTAFLLFALVVMLAGSGAVFGEQFGLPRWLGTLAMALLAVGTVLLGLQGVLGAIAFVAPVLFGSVVALSAYSLFTTGLSSADWRWYRPDLAAVRAWPVAAVLYVAYNLVLALSVLAPLGKAAGDPGRLRAGGWLGGLALGIAGAAMNLGLMAALPDMIHFEVPMLYLARTLPPAVTTLYTLVLWAEIYTTATGALYGVAARLSGAAQGPRYRLVAVVATLMGLGLSQVGFTQLIVTVLPFMGYAGIVLLAAVTWRWLRNEQASRVARL